MAEEAAAAEAAAAEATAAAVAAAAEAGFPLQADTPPDPPRAEPSTPSQRKPLPSLSRLEFLTDLLAFLRQRGEDHLIPASAVESPLAFPEKKLNGKHLDLYGLYKQVTMRGGFQVRSGGRHPFSWSGEIFPNMKHNYTRNHRATSVGHDLIKYYTTYLAAYESAHPRDVIPYGVIGTPHSASAAARAAAAPLVVGDRIEVWWPLDKAWFAAAVVSLSTEDNVVEAQYDDGDRETLRLAQERWRRERVLSNAPSKKKKRRAEGEDGGSGLAAMDGKRKRHRPSRLGAQVGTETPWFLGGAARPPGAPAEGHLPGGDTGSGRHLPQARLVAMTGGEGEGEAAARLRARAERRKAASRVTRHTAALAAAADPQHFPPADCTAHWLRLRGLGGLAPLFAAHEIDLEVLPLLTGEDLEDMGLLDFCTRMEVLLHCLAEGHARARAQVAAELATLTTRQGQKLAGVRDAPLRIELEEAAEAAARAADMAWDGTMAAAPAGAMEA